MMARRVGLAALLLLMMRAAALAQAASPEMPVPIEHQLPLLLKVMTYDMAFDAEAHDELHVAVVYDSTSPRSAINCMPTQIPRNGRPLSVTASLSASRIPGKRPRPAMQSAKAPTPGKTIRSALATLAASS